MIRPILSVALTTLVVATALAGTSAAHGGTDELHIRTPEVTEVVAHTLLQTRVRGIGGTPPYRFAFDNADGYVEGFVLSATTGWLRGSPTPGDHTVPVLVTDAAGGTARTIVRVRALPNPKLRAPGFARVHQVGDELLIEPADGGPARRVSSPAGYSLSELRPDGLMTFNSGSRGGGVARVMLDGTDPASRVLCALRSPNGVREVCIDPNGARFVVHTLATGTQAPLSTAFPQGWWTDSEAYLTEWAPPTATEPAQTQVRTIPMNPPRQSSSPPIPIGPDNTASVMRPLDRNHLLVMRAYEGTLTYVVVDRQGRDREVFTSEQGCLASPTAWLLACATTWFTTEEAPGRPGWVRWTVPDRGEIVFIDLRTGRTTYTVTRPDCVLIPNSFWPNGFLSDGRLTARCSAMTSRALGRKSFVVNSEDPFSSGGYPEVTTVIDPINRTWYDTAPLYGLECPATTPGCA